MKNSIKRILCIAICLCTVLLLAAEAVSCKKGEESNGEGAKEGEVAVVRVAADMKKGEQITSDKVYIDYIAEEKIHFNAIREIEKVVDKYLAVDVAAGDYLFAGKLVGDSNGNDGKTSAYLSVKEYIKEGEDSTDIIQNLIYENSGGTLYFADGIYLISKPLVLSASSVAKVSFELSDFAVIKAADSWSADDAMIRIGANDTDADEASANVTLKGGFIDGNGKAKGISVEGGRDAFISNVTVKNATVGITLAKCEYDTRTTVENTNIVAAPTASDTAVGMEINCDENAFENILIDNTLIGVKLTGKNNILKNIHATYNGAAKNSIGFEDKGEHNSYDMCFSENYSTGFYMGSNVKGSVYVGCYTFWNNGVTAQTAYWAEGSFDSVIRSGRADFDDTEANCAYLITGESEGIGRVLWPLIRNVANIDITDYEAYLIDTKVIEILD